MSTKNVAARDGNDPLPPAEEGGSAKYGVVSFVVTVMTAILKVSR